MNASLSFNTQHATRNTLQPLINDFYFFHFFIGKTKSYG